MVVASTYQMWKKIKLGLWIIRQLRQLLMWISLIRSGGCFWCNEVLILLVIAFVTNIGYAFVLWKHKCIYLNTSKDSLMYDFQVSLEERQGWRQEVDTEWLV